LEVAVTAFAPLLGLLEDVPDPRRAQGRLYQLPHVVLFAILAIVSGANSYRGIFTFIDVHRCALNAIFHLNWRRAPAHTAIRYILSGLDAKALEVAFRRHAALLQAALAKAGQVGIAIDGKTLRGSFDNFRNRAAAQILTAFATETALVLAHLDIDEKSNEIPAAQALLVELALAGHLVTLDALHCQKKTFEAAAAANAALVVQVKDNQPTLHQQAREICTGTVPLSSTHSRDKGRGRDERRTVSVFNPADKFVGSEWKPHVATIIRVERNVLTRSAKTGLWERSSEIALYVANTLPTATRAAEATRGHWAIENTSHYSRDVTMGEDASRIRSNPGVFARLRSFAFNILKTNRIGNLAQDRYRAALRGIDNLLNYLAIPER
jgi:predicted transposase YbfD/YdcC